MNAVLRWIGVAVMVFALALAPVFALTGWVRSCVVAALRRGGPR